MKNSWNAHHCRPASVFLMLFFLINTGCQHGGAIYKGEKPPAIDIRKIVITGFKPAVYQGDNTGYPSADLSRGTAPADPALFEKSKYMTSRLFEAMSAHEGYELVGPDRAKEVLSEIDGSGQAAGGAEDAGMVARELNADAAVFGFLYRWKDREGSDYAVKSPASIFFDLYIVGPDGGSILWKGRFNKTQRSLNENLLDIRTFFKGKGKWMTADDLAGLGLNDLVDDMFLFMGKGSEAEN